MKQSALFPHFITPTIALVLSFIVGGGFIYLTGNNPLLVYERLFSETLGSWYGVGQVLFKATTLICTGMAAAISFRSGLFNIGGEGQLIVGGFLMALVGFTFPTLPAVVLLPLCLCAGLLGGGVWGAIPGILKARFGSHEVINTIMLNFIAAAIVSYLVNSVFVVPATIHTPPVGESAYLPRLGEFLAALRSSPVNMALFVSLAAATFMWYLLWKHRIGYELRATGLSPRAAEYAGINVGKQTILAMTIAGAMAGLGGANFVLGYKHYYEIGFSDGAGFMGIAVALLGRNHPFGIVLAAFFFGMLEYGGLAINTMVPKELVNILQAIVIIFVLVFSKYLNSWIERLQHRAAESYA